MVEAFKVVLLAPWSSQTTPRDVTRCPIPKLVTRLSFSESTSASNSCRTYAWVALATPTSPANRSSETCRNAGLPATTNTKETPFSTRSVIVQHVSYPHSHHNWAIPLILRGFTGDFVVRITLRGCRSSHLAAEGARHAPYSTLG